MKLHVAYPRAPRQSQHAWALLERMLSPLCGLDQRISLSLLGEVAPPVICAGAELTGVHVLLGTAPPPPGSYHIGGMGLSPDDALIRTLAETVERYAQLTAEVYGLYQITLETHAALVAQGRHVLAERHLSLFEPQQHGRPGFPYGPFDRHLPLGWVEGGPLTGGPPCLVPAQLVFVGYRTRAEQGEPIICSAVTTGTAAHLTHDRALANALLELIQIDSAVGHWYSSWKARRVLLDGRVGWVDRVIRRYGRGVPGPQFFWLPNPDLPGFTIACLFRGAGGGIPAVAVGLGCDLGLAGALYKAWLEAIGVCRLAAIEVLQLDAGAVEATPEGEPGIYDLDTNVAWYASGHGARLIEERFEGAAPVATADLPPDLELQGEAAVSYLVEAFRRTGKELNRWDLTAPDVGELGFAVERVWSPDTLGLPLPSAPPRRHERFRQYGGASHGHPHPYP